MAGEQFESKTDKHFLLASLIQFGYSSECLTNPNQERVNNMFKFIGIALLTAIATPFAPLVLGVGALKDVRQSGNGADAWLSIIAMIGGLIGTAVIGGLVFLATLNPPLAGIIYALWCFGVAAFFSTSN